MQDRTLDRCGLKETAIPGRAPCEQRRGDWARLEEEGTLGMGCEGLAERDCEGVGGVARFYEFAWE